MAYKIKLSLSKNSIDDTRATIKALRNEFIKLPSVINHSVAKECEEKMLSHHDNFIESLPKDPYPHYALTRMIDKKDSSIATIIGSQIIYDEFGTGDVGARSPHPEKSKYNLNDYSSGPYVSTHEDDNGHYWDFEGYRLYGVPAGKFVYNTIVEMKNGEAKKIAEKQIKNSLNKTLGGGGDK